MSWVRVGGEIIVGNDWLIRVYAHKVNTEVEVRADVSLVGDDEGDPTFTVTSHREFVARMRAVGDVQLEASRRLRTDDWKKGGAYRV